MTDDDLRAEIDALVERVRKVEAAGERIKSMPGAVARLEGAVATLTEIVHKRFDTVDKGVSKASSWDTFIKFSASVVVPLLVALIGGYFLLKAGLAGAPK